jgi:hypothetical protein
MSERTYVLIDREAPGFVIGPRPLLLWEFAADSRRAPCRLDAVQVRDVGVGQHDITDRSARLAARLQVRFFCCPLAAASSVFTQPGS